MGPQCPPTVGSLDWLNFFWLGARTLLPTHPFQRRKKAEGHVAGLCWEPSQNKDTTISSGDFWLGTRNSRRDFNRNENNVEVALGDVTKL